MFTQHSLNLIQLRSIRLVRDENFNPPYWTEEGPQVLLRKKLERQAQIDQENAEINFLKRYFTEYNAYRIFSLFGSRYRLMYNYIINHPFKVYCFTITLHQIFITIISINLTMKQYWQTTYWWYMGELLKLDRDYDWQLALLRMILRKGLDVGQWNQKLEDKLDQAYIDTYKKLADMSDYYWLVFDRFWHFRLNVHAYEFLVPATLNYAFSFMHLFSTGLYINFDLFLSY